jgi:four helix bundle protein
MKFKEPDSTKVYDLEERTFLFAKNVRKLIRKLPNNMANEEDSRQLIRASASIGANYIEANNSLGEKDFAMRIKISRKESKESSFFLRLLDPGENSDLDNERLQLADEARQLMKIFGAILEKTKQ